MRPALPFSWSAGSKSGLLGFVRSGQCAPPCLKVVSPGPGCKHRLQERVPQIPGFEGVSYSY